MSPELKAAIERCKGYVMSPKERFEQRVSFIFGMLDANDTRTKDDIRKSVAAIYGVDLSEH